MKKLILGAVALAGFSAMAGVKWMTTASDAFDTHMTFAEQWQASDGQKVKCADGVAAFNGKAWIRRKGETPDAFRASVKVSVKKGKAGIRCGKTEDIAAAGETKVLTIDCSGGGCKLKTIEVFADGVATADDFTVEVPVDENASPNLMVDSGFEYSEDGAAPFFGYRGDMNWDGPVTDYEKYYLKRFTTVTDEKHSGQQSLRVWLNRAYHDFALQEYYGGTGGPAVARPKVKGGISVFSAWMKASRAGIKVVLCYGKNKTVELTTDWVRYEVSTTNGARTATVRIPGRYKEENYVWMDDLQCEVILPKPGEKYDPAKTYATEWRACEADKRFFSEYHEPPRPATVTVKKLPKGFKPTTDFGAWADKAAEVGPFWVNSTKVPNKKTTACIACDDDNLYIGWRNEGEDVKGVNLPKSGRKHDTPGTYSRDSIEFLFKHEGAKAFYHFFGAPNGDLFDKYNDKNDWDGEWSVAARATDGAVEYLATVPFKTMIPQGFAGRLYMNICRNDSHDWSMRECIATTRALGWRKDDAWGAYDLPADVAERWIAEAKKYARANATAKQPEVLSRLDYYMDEKTTEVRIWDENGDLHEASLDISKLPVGTNLVDVVADGRTYRAKIVKLPYRDNAIQINRFARCVQRHGRKILFTGFCHAPRWMPRRKDGSFPQVDVCRAAGFRDFHFAAWSGQRDFGAIKWLLDLAERDNLNILLWSGHDFDESHRGKKDGVMWDDFIAATDRKCVVSQMVIDEPDLGLTSEWTRDYLRKEKRLFPYTPVQMNNSIFGIPSRFADLETDILMIDNYLTAAQRVVAKDVVKHMDVMREADRGKPYWIFLVSENTGLHYKTPSYAEQIAQSWGCLCAGSTGLSWYMCMPTCEGTWRAMTQVNREAQSLEQEILSEEKCEPAHLNIDEKDVRILTRRYQGATYLFTCNTVNEPRENVVFTLGKDAPQNGTVEVLFENRTIPLKDGTFTDNYPTYTRHVYRIK